jgi:molecular chaperone IbpA
MNEFKLFDFHKLDPFAIGFENLLKDLQSTAQKIPTYPPYNIKRVNANKYVIEMAVAGFSKSDIEVTLEGNKLTVSGSAKENEEQETFFHKGIANRDFKHTFQIADKIEIGNAELVNGMLRIWLDNMLKTQDTVKKIAVTSKNV